MEDTWLRRPRSMGSLLPPNYVSDGGRFDLGLHRVRPAWLMNESIGSLDRKFPMVPAPAGTIVLYTTPLGEKLQQQSRNKEFDLTDPLRPSLSYNYLHDEHLKVYFRSSDIRRRLKDEGFITDDGFVKCSLKEFNEYRQWIRKLKLDELNRERRLDTKQMEEARKERLEKRALERDPELVELMRQRQERRKEEAKLRQKRIKKEQRRQKKLAEIDRKRREEFMDLKRQARDRVQLKRIVDRERIRKENSEKERKEQNVRLHIAAKIESKNDQRMKKLLEKKKKGIEDKAKQLEEQWYRRQSWSIEHHENQRRLRELLESEFQHNVEKRNIIVERQRRLSQVCFDEIAEANRRAFETDAENAEVFLAKLKEKKSRELEKWKARFGALKAAALPNIKTPCRTTTIVKKRKRSRRQSSWDIESCLLKDLGLEDYQIQESAYSKLGVISRKQSSLKELEFLEESDGLGSLREAEEDEERKVFEHDDEQKPEFDEGQPFSIPMIVESLASIREPSDTDSELSTSSGYTKEDHPEGKPSVSRFPSSTNQERMSHEELRKLISTYVENILHRSSQVLGIRIKMPDRKSLVKEPAIVEETKTMNVTSLKETEKVKMRVQVKEFLSSILDKVEQEQGVIIKRPPEYEQIKEKQRRKTEEGTVVETPVAKTVVSEQNYKNKRNMARKLVCDIVQSAAKQKGVIIKFPSQYQSLLKQIETPCKRPLDKESFVIASPSDNSMDYTTVHIKAFKDISSSTTSLKSTTEVKGIPKRNSNPEDKTEDDSENDKLRAENLRGENLIMTASRLVVQALSDAVLIVRGQRRCSKFFMSEMPKMFLDPPFRPPNREETARLRRERSLCFKSSLQSIQEEHIPRENDFIGLVSMVPNFDQPNATKGSTCNGQDVKNNIAKIVNFEAVDKEPGAEVETPKKTVNGIKKQPAMDLQDKVVKRPAKKIPDEVSKKIEKKIPDKVAQKSMVKIPDKVAQMPGGKVPDRAIDEQGSKIPNETDSESVKKMSDNHSEETVARIQGQVSKETEERTPNTAGKEPTKKIPDISDKGLGEKLDKKVKEVPEKRLPEATAEGTGERVRLEAHKELEKKIPNKVNEEPDDKKADLAKKIPEKNTVAEISEVSGEKTADETKLESEKKRMDKFDKEPEKRLGPGSKENILPTSGPIAIQNTDLEVRKDQESCKEPSDDSKKKAKNQLKENAKNSASGLELKSSSLRQITSQSSTFGLENSVRSGAATPDREIPSSSGRHIAGSPSSAILKVISMRERQEDSDLSPQASYVVLPKLSLSESTFVAGKMERLLKDCGQVSNASGSKAISQERFPVLSPVPSSEAEISRPTSAKLQDETVKLPQVSSVEISPRRSPTPPRHTSQSSQVSLPHIGGSNSSLSGLNETATATEDLKPGKTKIVEVTPMDLPAPVKDISLKNGDSKTEIKDGSSCLDTEPKQSENEHQKGKPATRTKSELSRKTSQDETQASRRRGSKYHSSMALVSSRRMSHVEERKTSHQEMNKSTVKVSSRTSVKRVSMSKSTVAEQAVSRGRNDSQGSEWEGPQGRGSTTTVHKSNAVETVKNVDSPTTVSSNLTGKTKNKKLSDTRLETSPPRPQEKSVLAIETPKASEDVSSQSKVDTKKEQNAGDQQPLSSLRDRALSKEHEKSANFLKDSQSKDTSASSGLEAKLTNVEQKTVDISTKTSDDGTNLSDLNASVADDKLAKNGNEVDSTPEGTKTSRPRKKKKIAKTKHFTKNKTDAKTSELHKKPGTEEEIKSPKSKTSSKTIAFAPISKLDKVSKNLNDEVEGVSEKTKSILKKTSDSNVKRQQSKEASRVASADIAPISSKFSRETSSPIEPQSKHGLETGGEDVLSPDALERTESDTEVVVQVHVPDTESPTEVPHQSTVSKKRVVSTEKSTGDVDRSKDHEDRNVDGVSSSLSVKEEVKEQPIETTKNAKDNSEGDQLVVLGTSKTSSKKQGEIKKSSSRKGLGENSEKKLMNVIPRNSLDILKVTKLSRKQPNVLTHDTFPLPANSESRQPQTKIPHRAPASQRPQGSRILRRKSLEGRPLRASNFGLSAEGFGLSVKSSTVVAKPHHSSVHRISSKVSSNLEKVDEGSSLETQAMKGHAPETAQSLSPPGHGNEALAKSLSIVRAAVVPKPSNTVAVSESQNENLNAETSTKSSHNSRKSSTPCISSTSFSDVVQGTQLLHKDSTKVEPSQNVSPRTSVGSLGSSSSKTISKHGAVVPSPPSTSKPDVVSPKVSRIMRNLSNGSSGKSRASLGSADMSPTASMEIVKLSSQTSHGWVSSPTSSVKFLPPIEARASKSSNHSDESQKRRPRTTESLISQTESAGSHSSSQSKKPAVIEIRRSSSGGLRVEGTSSVLTGVKSSTSGNSAKQAVIGF